jgi:BTB/POZ domain
VSDAIAICLLALLTNVRSHGAYLSVYSYVRLMDKPEFQFQDPQTPIILNVGGQVFETTVAVLTRDPYSILAACCRLEPILKPEPAADGLLYFDRDWWLFRHILAYLRSNVLPNELETLKELYAEASFYRLESLQRSIENIPIDAIQNFSPHAFSPAVGEHRQRGGGDSERDDYGDSRSRDRTRDETSYSRR